jgi:hypothetical protein
MNRCSTSRSGANATATAAVANKRASAPAAPGRTAPAQVAASAYPATRRNVKVAYTRARLTSASMSNSWCLRTATVMASGTTTGASWTRGKTAGYNDGARSATEASTPQADASTTSARTTHMICCCSCRLAHRRRVTSPTVAVSEHASRTSPAAVITTGATTVSRATA